MEVLGSLPLRLSPLLSSHGSLLLSGKVPPFVVVSVAVSLLSSSPALGCLLRHIGIAGFEPVSSCSSRDLADH